MLYAHPKVDSASARIRFVGFGSSSLDLEVFSYVTVTDYGEYLEVAEDLNLRIMDIVAAAGSSLAFRRRRRISRRAAGSIPTGPRRLRRRCRSGVSGASCGCRAFRREKIAEIENTLEYPADGSATGTGGGRR